MKKNLINLFLATGLTLFATSAWTSSLDLQKLSVHGGSYEVPVDNPELAELAVFPLRRVQLEQNGKEFTLKYNVPIELTGEVNRVEFKGTIENGQGVLTYEDTKMNCLADQSTLMCKVAYQNLKFNQERAERIITSRFEGDDLRKRLMIQKDFSTDPVGVIKIKLK